MKAINKQLCRMHGCRTCSNCPSWILWQLLLVVCKMPQLRTVHVKPVRVVYKAVQMALDNLFSTTMAIFSKTISSDKTPFRYMHRLCAVIWYFTVKCFNYTLYSWMLQCTACSHSPPQYSQYIHLVIVFSPLMLLLFAVVLQRWFSIEMHWATAVTTLGFTSCS